MLLVLTFGVLGASCVIPPQDVHGPCSKDSDCPDDKSPCTKEVCGSSGFCEKKPQDLPFGDKGCDDENPCTDEVCKDGACAHEPAASPPNDGNECTTDACVNGVAKYTSVMDGTACGLDGKLMCHGGKCNCNSADECGKSTECLKFACTDMACASTSLEKGTLVDQKDPGDCLKDVCDGANNVVAVPDQTDPPSDSTGNCIKKACDDQGNVVDMDDPADGPADDGNPCTNEGCNGGTPILHDPVADNTPCGNGPTCGPAAGGGYQVVPHEACVAGVCTTPVPASCGFYKCDAGGTACLAACTGVNDCIAGMFCDGATNACTPAQDTGNPCQTAGECSSGFCVDGLCCNSKCDGVCERCNDAASKGVCSAVQTGQDPDSECAGNDSCNGLGACAAGQGSTCGVDLDCLSGVCEDAKCCDMTCSGACNRCDLAMNIGTCTPAPLNMQVTGCTGTQACDGNGNCKSNTGQACGGNIECLSGFCQDGYCCNTACGGVCARCDLPGKEGTCTNVPQGQQVSGCNATNACDGANTCKKVNGQTCNATGDCVSGFCPDEGAQAGQTQKYCCDAACAAQCYSCAGSKTTGGVNGVCDTVKDNTDPDLECAGNCMANGNGCCNVVNGSGVCQ